MQQICFVSSLSSYTGQTISKYLHREGYHVLGCMCCREEKPCRFQHDDDTVSRNEVPEVSVITESDVVILCGNEPFCCIEKIISALSFCNQKNLLKSTKKVIYIDTIMADKTQDNVLELSDKKIQMEDSIRRRSGVGESLGSTLLREKVIALSKSKYVCVHRILTGILYGSGEKVFHSFFSAAWNGQSFKIPSMGCGNNMPPISHIGNVCETILSLVENPNHMESNTICIADSGNAQYKLKDICAAIQNSFKAPSFFDDLNVNKEESAASPEPMDSQEFLDLLSNQSVDSYYVDRLQLDIPMSGTALSTGFVDQIEAIKEEFIVVNGLQPRRILLVFPPGEENQEIEVELSNRINVREINLRNYLDEVQSEIERGNLKTIDPIECCSDIKSDSKKEKIAKSEKINSIGKTKMSDDPDSLTNSALANELIAVFHKSEVAIPEISLDESKNKHSRNQSLRLEAMKRLFSMRSCAHKGYVFGNGSCAVTLDQVIEQCLKSAKLSECINEYLTRYVYPTHLVYVHTPRTTLLEKWDSIHQEAAKLQGSKSSKSKSSNMKEREKYIQELNDFFGSGDPIDKSVASNVESIESNSEVLEKHHMSQHRRIPDAIKNLCEKFNLTSACIVDSAAPELYKEIETFLGNAFQTQSNFTSTDEQLDNNEGNTADGENVCSGAIYEGTTELRNAHEETEISANGNNVHEEEYVANTAEHMYNELVKSSVLTSVGIKLRDLVEESDDKQKLPFDSISQIGRYLMQRGIEIEERRSAMNDFRKSLSDAISEKLDSEIRV